MVRLVRGDVRWCNVVQSSMISARGMISVRRRCKVV